MAIWKLDESSMRWIPNDPNFVIKSLWYGLRTKFSRGFKWLWTIYFQASPSSSYTSFLHLASSLFYYPRLILVSRRLLSIRFHNLTSRKANILIATNYHSFLLTLPYIDICIIQTKQTESFFANLYTFQIVYISSAFLASSPQNVWTIGDKNKLLETCKSRYTSSTIGCSRYTFISLSLLVVCETRECIWVC